MIDKRYYEKLGGFTYLLGELRKKLGREQENSIIKSIIATEEKADAYFE